MKQLFLVFIFSISSIVVNAQSSSSDTTDIFSGKILLFQVNGLAYLSLDNFSGGIGVMRNLNENMRLRNMYSLQLFNTTNYSGEKTTYRFKSSSISTDLMFLYRKRENIRPYWGAGLGLGVGDSYRKSDKPNYFEQTQRRDLMASLRGFIGFEYLYSGTISFSAEYLLDGKFIYSENKYYYNYYADNSQTLEDYIRREYTINLDTFSIVMAVYF